MEDLLSAMLNPSHEFHVLNCAPTMDQAEIIWKYCERKILDSPRVHHWIADIVQSPFPTIRFKHGTEITARSTHDNCKYIEGHKYLSITWDEFIYDTASSHEVLKMRVADRNGCLSGGATPVLGQNWSYRDIWRPCEQRIAAATQVKMRPSGYLLTGSSYENPHVDHNYLRKQEAEMSPNRAAVRIHGKWIDDETKRFKGAAIAAITKPDLNPDMKRLVAFVKGEVITEVDRALALRMVNLGYWVVGWDLAKAADWTVGIALDIRRTPWRLLYYDRYQRRLWPEVERDIKHVQTTLRSNEVIIDGTSIGEVVHDHLDIESWKVESFKFTKPAKDALLTNLERCIDGAKFWMPLIPQLVNELHDYENDDEDLECDCVMSLALACWKAENRSIRPESY